MLQHQIIEGIKLMEAFWKLYKVLHPNNFHVDKRFEFTEACREFFQFPKIMNIKSF